MGQSDESRQSRRGFLVAAGAAVTGGCLGSGEDENTGSEETPTGTATDSTTAAGDADDDETEDGDTATETATLTETHPLADRTATVTIERVEADRDRLERLLRAAIAFWNDNSGRYLSYATTLAYQPDATDPAIVVSELPAIDECGIHDSGEFAGCATYLTPGDEESLPANVRLVAEENDWLYRTIIQHELGHVLGLGHEDDPANIMDNSIEARYPEFEQRKEILNRRNQWVREYNAATEALSAAFEDADDDDYETAAGEYEAAGQRYVAADELLDTATDIATGLSSFEPADRDRLMTLLDTERAFVDSMRSAVEKLQTGSEQIATDDGGYVTYNEGVDIYNRTVQQSLPETEAYVAAVGLVHITVESADE